MGQKCGRHGDQSFNGMSSPVFAVDKVRGAKGGFSVTSRYHVNRSLRQDYRVERHILGSGASGPVHLAKRGNRQFAVKSFRKRGLSPEAKAELRGEVEVYLKLDHPHVARLEDVYETDRDLHLVMELMSGGELYARLAKRRHYSEKDAAQTCRQMLLAIAYLHGHNIVHRDLKLENFLYERQDTEHLKLIDFGFAKYHERGSGKMSRSCGSLHYIAPEVLKHSYDEKADMWSIGVIVYMLLTGNPPFYGSTDEKCLYRIQRGEPGFSKRWWTLSGGAQTFVLSLLALDPEARPGAAEALKRPWLQQGILTPKATIDGEVLASLRSFAQASHFRRACLSMMAWSLTLEDQQELRVQFQMLDTNKSGTITQHELASVLKANFDIDSAETETLFKSLDSKGSKEISYAEFLAAAMKKRMRMHEDVLQATFERFDVEGTGTITPSNLRALLGDSFEGSDVEELIREADVDGDGRVSYADFLSYLQEGDMQEEVPSSEASSSVDLLQASSGSLFQVLPKLPSPASTAMNEQSTRFLATRTFTEIIDSAEMAADGPAPALTPKRPKSSDSPLKRVGDDSPLKRLGAELAALSPSALNTEKRHVSGSATSTPPVASSEAVNTPDQGGGLLLDSDDGGIHLRPASKPTSTLPIPCTNESCQDTEAGLALARPRAGRGSLPVTTRPRPRWAQCMGSSWPPWSRCITDEAGNIA